MDFNLSDIEIKLRDKISNEISLREEGVNRFRIFNPYEFDDGDHFSIFLKKENGNWKFTDEAHTIMHLSYDMDISAFKKGNRQKIITNTISNFGLEENQGKPLPTTVPVEAKTVRPTFLFTLAPFGRMWWNHWFGRPLHGSCKTRPCWQTPGTTRPTRTRKRQKNRIACKPA